MKVNELIKTSLYPPNSFEDYDVVVFHEKKPKKKYTVKRIWGAHRDSKILILEIGDRYEEN